MDDETERLIRQLQQQDAAEYNRSRGLGARERKAPEVYVPPPPGVGTLLKSDKPPESARDEGRREKRARDQRDTRASTPAKSGGSTKSATQSAEKPSGGRVSKSAEPPQSGGRSSRSRDASASTKPPLEGYVLHQEDVWKKVTPRPGGGDHCDIIYKRFDPTTREEQPFHDCNRVGEYVKGENMKSLRSVSAVNRYLERRNKAKTKADRTKTEKAPKSAEKAPKSAEKPPSRREASARSSEERGNATGMPPPPARGSRSRPARGDPSIANTPSKAPASKDASPVAVSAEKVKGGRAARSAARGEAAAAASVKAEADAEATALSLSAGVDAQAAKAMARYALERMGRDIRGVAEQIERERALAPGGEVPELMPGGTYRLVCDRCANSIADCFRHCDGCENDFCLECCADVRSTNGTACPHCVEKAKTDAAAAKAKADSMTLKVRSFSVTTKRSLDAARAMPDPLADLAALVDEYGEGKVRPEEDAKPCARCATAANASSRSKRSSTAAASGAGGDAAIRTLSTPGDSCPVWAPRYADVDPRRCGADAAATALSHFQKHWRRGDPVVVRGVEGERVGCWTPAAVTAAITDRSVDVIDCASGERKSVGVEAFFQGFNAPGDEMLKVKDWPSEDDFKQKLPRHYADFVRMLPFQPYTNPVDGPLNLSCRLPKEWVPPDLGPKSYVAYGREAQRGMGDSVTRLHQDMSDAVNVLLHVEPRGPAGDVPVEGARWDIFRRQDFATLQTWLVGKVGEGSTFLGNLAPEGTTQDDGKKPTGHPIHDVRVFLTDADLAALAKDTGIKPWTFDQREGDAVFVPAGCAHQVRNLRSCLKVALDFVSPESAGECLVLARGLRKYDIEDKLQGRAMMLHGARHADVALNNGRVRTYGKASAAAVAAIEREEAAAAAAKAKTVEVKVEKEGVKKEDAPAGKRVKSETAPASNGGGAAEAASRASKAASRASKAAEAAEAAAARAKSREAALDDEHDEAAELLLGLGAFTAKPAPKRAKPKVEAPPAKKAKPAAKPVEKTEAAAPAVNPLAAYQAYAAALMAQQQQPAQAKHGEQAVAAALSQNALSQNALSQNAAAPAAAPGAPSFFGGVTMPPPASSAPAPSVTQNPQVAAYAALQQQQAFQEEMQRGLMQQQMMMNYAAQNPMMAAMMQQNPEVMRQFMALMQGQGAPPQQPP